MVPRFVKNDFSESQHKIVSQGLPQQVGPVPSNNFLSQNLIEALSSKNLIQKLYQFKLSIKFTIA